MDSINYDCVIPLLQYLDNQLRLVFHILRIKSQKFVCNPFIQYNGHSIQWHTSRINVLKACSQHMSQNFFPNSDSTMLIR